MQGRHVSAPEFCGCRLVVSLAARRLVRAARALSDAGVGQTRKRARTTAVSRSLCALGALTALSSDVCLSGARMRLRAFVRRLRGVSLRELAGACGNLRELDVYGPVPEQGRLGARR